MENSYVLVQAGVENVSRVFCVELYGGPIHRDCFVQFNPDARASGVPLRDEAGAVRKDPRTGETLQKPSPFQRALQRMHVFYLRMLLELVSEHYGVSYSDPAEMADPAQRHAALQRQRAVCEIEQSLYKQRDELRTQKAPSLESRVVVQT